VTEIELQVHVKTKQTAEEQSSLRRELERERKGPEVQSREDTGT
jgi:hypothetical protein